MEYMLENENLSLRFQSLGGALSSIRDRDGMEYLWQGDKRYWSGQAPVLFPICGSLRGDRAVLKNGKETRMPRHGIARKREFSCVGQTADTITFALESDGAMEEQYPFPFRLEIAYHLSGRSIRTQYRVINRGEEEMPFVLGGHPGFRCPLYETEDYGDYRLVFEKEESCSVPFPVTETGLIDMSRRTPFLNGQKELALSHELFEKDAVILDRLRSRRVKLVSRTHAKGVELEFSQFPYLILWSSANGGPFLALEPWLGLSTCSDEGDVFEEKRGVQSAKPGEEKQYSFEITVL